MGESAPKPAGVSPAVLVLSLLLTVATTGALHQAGSVSARRR